MARWILNTSEELAAVNDVLETLHDAVVDDIRLSWMNRFDAGGTLTLSDDLAVSMRLSHCSHESVVHPRIRQLSCEFRGVGDVFLDFQGFQPCDWTVFLIRVDVVEGRAAQVPTTRFRLRAIWDVLRSGQWQKTEAARFTFSAAQFAEETTAFA